MGVKHSDGSFSSYNIKIDNNPTTDYVVTDRGDWHSYSQNLTLSGTKTYETGHAMIGSDVTNKVTQGPVVVNSGNTMVKASQGATVTKDFEVKLGAEFTITNE